MGEIRPKTCEGRELTTDQLQFGGFTTQSEVDSSTIFPPGFPGIACASGNSLCGIYPGGKEQPSAGTGVLIVLGPDLHEIAFREVRSSRNAIPSTLSMIWGP